jgi:hypothetical protein
MSDPKGISTQIEPTQTIATSFLDHNGVLGKVSLPLLIPPANPSVTTARTPRVPTLKYPIAPHTLAAWKLQVEIDSHSPTSLVITTANAILHFLQNPSNPPYTRNPTEPELDGRDQILSLAADLQNILGDAMHMATAVFPLKVATPGKGQTLPHHL